MSRRLFYLEIPIQHQFSLMACEYWQYAQRRRILAAGKQFDRRNPGGFQGKIILSSGQKTRRLGLLTMFKQALGVSS